MLTNNFLDQSLMLECGTKFSSTLLMSMNEDSRKYMVGQINKLLSKSTSKIDGIQLLNESLSQFSPQIICEHGPGWITNCLNHHDQNIEAYLRTLANIITYSQNHSDFNKKFVSDFLTPTIDMTLKKTGDINVKEASLNCLVSCLNNYPSSCNFFKARIEEYALSFLDTSSDKLNLASGLVFFHCQQIGNAGSDGNNFVRNITLCIRRLCVTCHKLFDSILEDQIEYEKYGTSDVEPLNIKPAPIHYTDHMKLHREVQCLKNSLNWTMIFLRKSGSKVIYLQEIVSVIQRGISSHSCPEQDLSNFESTHFAFHFIPIQMEVLKLLGILIRLMRVMLFPFYHTISKIILDAVMRSHSCSCYFKNNLIPEYLYDVFIVWLKLGGTELDQSMQDKLINFFINHVFINDSRVSLRLDTNIGNSLKLSKLQQKSIRNKTSEVSLSVSSLQYNSIVYYSALNTLHILFKHTHLCLRESVLNSLYSFLLKSALSIQNGQATFPLAEQKCQLMLYQILCSIFEQNSLKILPPLQIIINILQKGSSGDDESIKGICLEGLNNLEKLCQPVCKTLFTLDDKKYRNKSGSQQTNVLSPINGMNNSHDTSTTPIRDEVHTAPRDLEVKVLYNEVVVPPVQEFDVVVDTKGCKADGLKLNEKFGQKEKCSTHEKKFMKMVTSSNKDKVKSNLKNVEEIQEVKFPKKRKLEQDSDSIINSFVDVVNWDYE